MFLMKLIEVDDSFSIPKWVDLYLNVNVKYDHNFKDWNQINISE